MAALLVPILVCGGSARAADRDKKARNAAKAPGRAEFIDRLLEASWNSAGVKPARPASDDEYLRRAYLDLLGRIPSVQEAKAFLHTREPDRREKLVDYLLEQADYPENFATQWTVLLIGRGNQGRMVDRGALAGWLRKQFSANRPWNEVVYDLITATGSNRENGAVNYVLAHLQSEAVPLTSRTTRLFLGQQLQCTQCHDHPSNEWKQGDFWGINAFFKGVRAELKRTDGGAGRRDSSQTELSDRPTDAFVRFDKRNGMVGIAFPKFLDGRKISQGTDVVRRVELGKLIADPKNEALARAFANRMWGHFVGRGLVNPVDDIGPHNPPSHPELLDRLAKGFQASGYDVKRLIRTIMASRPYQASSVRTKGSEKEEGAFNVMALRPMSPEQLFDSLLVATNAHHAGGSLGADRKRDEWMRQFLFAFGNDEGDEATSFQGTIPQALMMMNGELMRDALSGKPGSFLADCIEAAGKQSREPEAYMVGQIYLAALSRYPTAREMQQAGRYLSSYPDTLGVLQDLFWALLNSNEFILIH
jgi:hypothetical protein